MAKGNVGNLLQHFVVLRIAQRLLSLWAKPNEPVEYVDCYSMEPWEIVDDCKTPQQRTFSRVLQLLVTSMDQTDIVAKTFKRAWKSEYGDSSSTSALEREYPNSAVLLREGFPDQHWNMRLHEIRDRARDKLCKWASMQTSGSFEVAGEWDSSSLVVSRPAPIDRPVLVVLDPYQVVPDASPKAGQGGYLLGRHLRYLVGTDCLNFESPCERTAPCVFLVFSYSDQDVDRPHRVVSDAFIPNGWKIERVSTGPLPDVGRTKSHQGWVITRGLSDDFILGISLQKIWDEWFHLVTSRP